METGEAIRAWWTISLNMRWRGKSLYHSPRVHSFPKLLILALPLTSCVIWGRSLPLCEAQSLRYSKICSKSDILVPHMICMVLGRSFEKRWSAPFNPKALEEGGLKLHKQIKACLFITAFPHILIVTWFKLQAMWQRVHTRKGGQEPSRARQSYSKRSIRGPWLRNSTSGSIMSQT